MEIIQTTLNYFGMRTTKESPGQVSNFGQNGNGAEDTLVQLQVVQVVSHSTLYLINFKYQK